LAANVSTREDVAASLLGFSLSLEREQKAKNFALVKRKKRIKDRYLNQQNLRVQKVENFILRRIGSRGLPDRIFGSRGTRRKKLLDVLPLLVKARFFRMCRRRRRSPTSSFQRIFGIISVLAFLSLGGFGRSRNRINLNRSSLWERRTGNRGLVALHKSKSQNFQESGSKIREGEY
jgi:hypothetical protein